MPTPSPAPLNPDPLSSDLANPTPPNTGSTSSSLDPTQLAELLTRLASGQATVADVLAVISVGAADRVDSTKMSSIDGATVDLGRQERCGFGEVIYGEGKPSELIERIARVQIDAEQNVLVTRIDPSAATELAAKFDHAQHNAIARTLRLSGKPICAAQAIQSPATPPDASARVSPHVAVVTAGSTDAPVAAEAMETLAWMGIPFTQFDDIGVAGPQRLVNAVPTLRQASAVIVVAGMEGALPSVVSGHLSVPIFAVPTSVGYGATLAGLTPLLGMLSSCAAGVAVVNIDAGFKAGYLAGLVIDQLRRANR